jgi:hypothetical protein
MFRSEWQNLAFPSTKSSEFGVRNLLMLEKSASTKKVEAQAKVEIKKV